MSCPTGCLDAPATSAHSATLPLALSSRAYTLLFAGDLPAAAALIEEVETVNEVTRKQHGALRLLGLAAFRGRSAEVAALSRDHPRRCDAPG